jgi:hypothetical protein
MPVTIVEVITSTHSCSNWRRALTDDSGFIAGKTRGVPRSEILARLGSIRRKSRANNAARNFGERSVQFDAGRSGTDNHERHPFVRDFRVRFVDELFDACVGYG